MSDKTPTPHSTHIRIIIGSYDTLHTGSSPRVLHVPQSDGQGQGQGHSYTRGQVITLPPIQILAQRPANSLSHLCSSNSCSNLLCVSKNCQETACASKACPQPLCASNNCSQQLCSSGKSQSGKLRELEHSGAKERPLRSPKSSPKHRSHHPPSSPSRQRVRSVSPKSPKHQPSELSLDARKHHLQQNRIHLDIPQPPLILKTSKPPESPVRIRVARARRPSPKPKKSDLSGQNQSSTKKQSPLLKRRSKTRISLWRELQQPSKSRSHREEEEAILQLPSQDRAEKVPASYDIRADGKRDVYFTIPGTFSLFTDFNDDEKTPDQSTNQDAHHEKAISSETKLTRGRSRRTQKYEAAFHPSDEDEHSSQPSSLQHRCKRQPTLQQDRRSPRPRANQKQDRYHSNHSVYTQQQVLPSVPHPEQQQQHTLQPHGTNASSSVTPFATETDTIPSGNHSARAICSPMLTQSLPPLLPDPYTRPSPCSFLRSPLPPIRSVTKDNSDRRAYIPLDNQRAVNRDKMKRQEMQSGLPVDNGVKPRRRTINPECETVCSNAVDPSSIYTACDSGTNSKEATDMYGICEVQNTLCSPSSDRRLNNFLKCARSKRRFAICTDIDCEECQSLHRLAKYYAVLATFGW